MHNTDDTVIALLDGSVLVSLLERVRERCVAAFDRSSAAGRWRSIVASWSSLRGPERRRQGGTMVLAAVITHVLLLATSSGFHAWVVYILPAIAGVVAALAIVTGAAEAAGKQAS